MTFRQLAILFFITFSQQKTLFCQNSSQFIQDKQPLEADSVSTDLIQVGNVTIRGNTYTKNNIVQREILIKKGNIYPAQELQKAIKLSKEQLMNTTLFVEVLVDTQVIDNKIVDVNFYVKERWYVFPSPYFRVIDRNWNVWLKDYGGSLARTNIGVKLRHENFTGRNDKFNLWLIGGYSKQIAFNYTRPFIDKKLRFGYQFAFEYGQNRELNYLSLFNKQQFYRESRFVRDHWRAEAAFTYRRRSRLYMQARLQYMRETIADTIAKINPDYFGKSGTSTAYLTLAYSLQYYNVDFIPYPTRGWYVDVFAIKRLMLEGDLKLAAIGGKAFATKRVLPKTWVDVHVAATLKLPQKQPFYNSKLMGYGDLYMQGLEYYVIDGAMGGFLRGTIRQQVASVAINNLFKPRQPESKKIIRKTFNTIHQSHNHIPFRFFVKAFANIGYVHNSQPATSFMNNRLLSTAGIGLDIVTIYDWTLKLELSFNQFDAGGISNLANKLFIHTQSDF